jgi:hypothetical protein
VADLKRVGELVGWLGTLGGALGAILAAEPSTESRVAFWILITAFSFITIHLGEFVWGSPVRQASRWAARRLSRRRYRRSFSQWVKVWFALDKVLREALSDATKGSSTEERRKKQVVDYLVLRRILQQHPWPFMTALECRIKDDLDRVLRDKGPSQILYSLERTLVCAHNPLRMLYSQPNLGMAIKGLAPEPDRCYWQVPEANDVLDRIEDIIREFGAGLSIDVSKLIGRL